MHPIAEAGCSDVGIAAGADVSGHFRATKDRATKDGIRCIDCRFRSHAASTTLPPTADVVEVLE